MKLRRRPKRTGHQKYEAIRRLDGGEPVRAEFAAGVAKLVRIDTAGGGSKRGFVDAYYGNAIIEFENSLKATEAHALEQLREYTSPLWNREGRGRRQFVCVLSDGIDWKTYRPTANATKGKLIPEDIELQELRADSLQLSTIVYLVLGGFVFVSTTPPSAHCCSAVEVS